jgi:hypothetical protein
LDGHTHFLTRTLEKVKTEMKMKLPGMLEQGFEPVDFALNLMLKDTRYSVDLANSLSASADMISGAAKALARAEAKGLGLRISLRWPAERRRARPARPLGGNSARAFRNRFPCHWNAGAPMKCRIRMAGEPPGRSARRRF